MEPAITSQQIIGGILVAVVIGVLAWRAGALAASGALAAGVIGSFIFGFGGGPWAALLFLVAVYFILKTG
jgi:uncharacterized membrane protein